MELLKKLDKVNKTDNILLLTHIDMDAAGAEILCRLGFDNLTVKNLSNNKMSDSILEAVQKNNETHEYDVILIDDISCSMENAKEIDDLKKKHNMRIVLLDHHQTALALNAYDWATVKVSLFSQSTIAYRYGNNLSKAHSSGTSLMYDYLIFNHVLDATPFLDELVHQIAAYDTWDWHYLFNDNDKYSNMDKMCDIYGMRVFVDEMYQRALKNYNSFELCNEKDMFMLEIWKTKLDDHLEHIKTAFKEATLTLENNTTLDIVWCITSDYLQDTFELMKTEYPEKDLYIINYGSGISMRGVKKDFNVGMFAKGNYGGGGHPGAAGFPIPEEMIHEYMEQILKGKIVNQTEEI